MDISFSGILTYFEELLDEFPHLKLAQEKKEEEDNEKKKRKSKQKQISKAKQKLLS